MKLIALTKGYFARVDDQDYERLSHMKWRATLSKPRKDGTRRVYAITSESRQNGKKPNVLMHRVILGLHGGDTDHENGDTLDNQRSNLRAATHSQNVANAPKRSGCTSRFKGVSWHKGRRKWEARIRALGIQSHLGMFRREENAATAYNFAAVEAFGEFALLNFPRSAQDEGKPK